MSSQHKVGGDCENCGESSFAVKDGFFYCTRCNVRNANLKDDVVEENYNSKAAFKITKIKKPGDQDDEKFGWTSWELYNAVLIGLAEELIELGVNPRIKLTILQLWATYLNKLEVAFTSTKKKEAPKLSLGFWKRDADILYGRVKKAKRRRKAGSSVTSGSVMSSSFRSDGSCDRSTFKKQVTTVSTKLSQSSCSEGDSVSLMSQSLDSVGSSTSQIARQKIRYTRASKREAKKILKKAKKMPRPERKKLQENPKSKTFQSSPQNMTPSKLWSILYLALRIHGEQIQISDMLRLAKEGRLSLYKLDHLVPADVKLYSIDLKLLKSTNELSHGSFRKIVMSMAALLEVRQILVPSLGELVERYCTELQLPRDIMDYSLRLLALSKPKMMFNFHFVKTHNYEGRAMAFIIFVLKLIFGLDGVTEFAISRLAEKMNKLCAEKNVPNSTCFSFCEWQRYMECRQKFLGSLHFPTQARCGLADFGNNRLFADFLRHIESKAEREEELIRINSLDVLPQTLLDSFKISLEKLNEDEVMENEPYSFKHSLTPNHSYIQQLLDDQMVRLPDILRINFVETKVDYVTKPEWLKDLAGKCGISMGIIDSSLNFIEKTVAPFENPRNLTRKIFTEKVAVVNENCDSQVPNLLDYFHRKELDSRIVIDEGKRELYENYKNLTTSRSVKVEDEDDDFAFSHSDRNGELLIGDPGKRVFDEQRESSVAINSEMVSRKQLCKQYNLYLSRTERKSITIERRRNEQDLEKSSTETETHDMEENETDIENGSSENFSKYHDVLFRPFKDYWMYDCKFSRVGQKDYRRIEREFPHTFSWLIRECASMLEMHSLDLYEELWVVENYFAHILKKEGKSKLRTLARKNIFQRW